MASQEGIHIYRQPVNPPPQPHTSMPAACIAYYIAKTAGKKSAFGETLRTVFVSLAGCNQAGLREERKGGGAAAGHTLLIQAAELAAAAVCRWFPSCVCCLSLKLAPVCVCVCVCSSCGLMQEIGTVFLSPSQLLRRTENLHCHLLRNDRMTRGSALVRSGRGGEGRGGGGEREAM